ncbi:MAG: redox-regulated ATPase YchF, partial [Halobacteriaceae archaeon]
CPCLERDCRCGNCKDGKRYVPIELLDVAGLVPGAHEGRGLGNQFLDELTNADAVLAIIDASGGTNEEGEPVEVGSYDPTREVDFIRDELEAWLADIVDRNWESVERKSRSPEFEIDDALADLLTGFGATEYDVRSVLREIEYVDDPLKWERSDFRELAAGLRSQTKPILVVANKIDVAPHELIKDLLALDEPVIPATAQGELALRRGAEADVIDYDPGDETFEMIDDVDEDQRELLCELRNTMQDYGGTGVQESLDTAVYDLLDQVTVYPVQDPGKWTDGTGEMLPDAFLLKRGSTPVDLAYHIHTDIGEGYLHAVDARESRQVSEEYELAEGDVIQIVSTAQ